MVNSSGGKDYAQTEKVRSQGRENGLFRACMDRIRSSHTTGQALRTALLTAGLLSDANCYAELLGQFYVTTSALEKRMDELMLTCEDEGAKTSSLLISKVKKLGYSFSLGYEKDLQSLLGSDWKTIIESWTTVPAKQYVQLLQSATNIECVAAVFILHGPLVIGGGAMLKSRVEKSFGIDATNVSQDVIGTVRGGRSKRRREFIELYDTLLDDDDGNESDVGERFSSIVEKCGECMQV